MREQPVPASRLTASMLPVLVGFVALAIGGRSGLTVMAAGFLGVLAYDIFAARRGFVPKWYPRLRWPLTGIALICLFGAILGGPL
jgi:fructose-specific phosphotransferase system IIC component